MPSDERRSLKDYGDVGLDIQTAMVRRMRSLPRGAVRAPCIRWNGVDVWTSYDIQVPSRARVRIEFLSDCRPQLQGIDLRAENGAILLPDGTSVEVLRTWHSPQLADVVEYPFTSGTGRLRVWNVYRRIWPDGRETEEKWTGNAGFQVESEADFSWLLRCSDGPSVTPDFARLVVRITILAG